MYFDRHVKWMTLRFLFYSTFAPASQAEKSDLKNPPIAVGAHSDHGTMTLLFQCMDLHYLDDMRLSRRIASQVKSRDENGLTRKSFMEQFCIPPNRGLCREE